MVKEEPQNKQGDQHFQLITWAIASVFISILSACFIASCVVTHLYCERSTGVFTIPEHHTEVTCIREKSELEGSTGNCCPIGWGAFQSKCYFPYNDNKTWAERERNCTGMGAHLATISTEAEQVGVLVSMGSPVALHLNTHFAKYSSYIAPTWLSVNTEKGWSCCPKNWKPFSLNCYFISTEYKNWTESEKNCSGMEAHLLVINTKDEQDFILQHLDKRSVYYVGLSDPEGTGDWQWVDQTPYKESATFWHPGEPSHPDERCAMLNAPRNRWGLNDASCDQLQNSICKMTKIN